MKHKEAPRSRSRRLKHRLETRRFQGAFARHPVDSNDGEMERPSARALRLAVARIPRPHAAARVGGCGGSGSPPGPGRNSAWFRAGSPPRPGHGRRARPWPRDTPTAGLRRGAFVIFFTLTGCNTGGHGSRRFSKIVNISTISALTRGGGIGTLRDRFALRNAPFPMVFPRDEIVKEVANRPRAAK